MLLLPHAPVVQAATPIKWCIPAAATAAQVAACTAALAPANTAGATFTCVAGGSEEECLAMVKAGTADLITLGGAGAQAARPGGWHGGPLPWVCPRARARGLPSTHTSASASAASTLPCRSGVGRRGHPGGQRAVPAGAPRCRGEPTAQVSGSAGLPSAELLSLPPSRPACSVLRPPTPPVRRPHHTRVQVYGDGLSGAKYYGVALVNKELCTPGVTLASLKVRWLRCAESARLASWPGC